MYAGYRNAAHYYFGLIFVRCHQQFLQAFHKSEISMNFRLLVNDRSLRYNKQHLLQHGDLGFKESRGERWLLSDLRCPFLNSNRLIYKNADSSGFCGFETGKNLDLTGFSTFSIFRDKELSGTYFRMTEKTQNPLCMTRPLKNPRPCFISPKGASLK